MEDNKEKDTNLPAQPDSSEEENAQPNKIKLKGRFKNYMRAPLFIIILLEPPQSEVFAWIIKPVLFQRSA